MSTFFERAAALGDGASEPLDLEVLHSALTLYGVDLITAANVRDWCGMTQEQFAAFLFDHSLDDVFSLFVFITWYEYRDVTHSERIY